jgi:hypothetical protein
MQHSLKITKSCIVTKRFLFFVKFADDIVLAEKAKGGYE